VAMPVKMLTQARKYRAAAENAPPGRSMHRPADCDNINPEGRFI